MVFLRRWRWDGFESFSAQTKGQGGVVDRLIVFRHRTLGATTVTFDRRQARLEGGVLLR
jgi:hypothetical protein